MFAEQIIKKIIFMKKKILGGLFAFAVMVATSYGVNRSMENDADLSDMALKNVEALALGEQGENDPFPPINPMCPNGCLANGRGCLCHIWHKDLKEAGKN